MSAEGLLVVRDRSHVKDRIRLGQKPLHVVTASEFFDQIRLLAFVADAEIIRDDEAALLTAADVLAEEDPRLLGLSSHYARLFSALTHGQSSPREVLNVLVHSNAKTSLIDIFSRLSRIGARMRTSRQIDGVGALANALVLLRQNKTLPDFIKRFSFVCFEGLVDLTELELNVILALAELGFSVQMTWPFDERGRGATLPVAYLLERVEQRHDLEQIDVNLVPIEGEGNLSPLVGAILSDNAESPDMVDRVHLCLASDVTREARWLAQVIAAIRRRDPRAPTIAVAMRSLDERSEFFKDALAMHGIAVHERKGRSVLSSPQAQLLFDFLYAKAQAIPKQRLLAILSHTAYNRASLQAGTSGQIDRHLRQAGLVSDVEDMTMPSGAYRHRLQRLLRSVGDDSVKSTSIQSTMDAVQRVIDGCSVIPEHARLGEYVQVAVKILEKHISAQHGEGWQILYDKLTHMEGALSASKAKISLLEYIKWLEKILALTTLPAEHCVDANAVELISLSELLGRQFDYVAIVDMVHGRLPKSVDPDPVLRDSDRFEINRLMGRQVLRLYEDNPLETSSVPPRQALEPMWFLGACAAAQEGLILTSSRQDENGRDQAKSEFFDAALLALGMDVETFSGAHTSLDLRPNRREYRFSLAKWAAHNDVEKSPVDVYQQDRIGLYRQMSDQRSRFFNRSSESSVLEVADTFAFKIDKTLFRRRFQNRLGLLPEHPLTPTRIEGLAQCRFRGYVEKLLNVDVEMPSGHDMDARTLGRLAHETLEEFYSYAGSLDDGLEKSDRARLSSILRRRASRYLDAEATGHRGVLRAYVTWLDAALQRLVSTLTKDPPVDGVRPLAFELPIGVGANVEKGSVPIPVGDETLYFGGILDRVDEGANARVVVDYKTSTGAAASRKIDEKEILHTHFQLPLYLRLLEYHSPTPPSTELLAYLAAIREGVTTKVLGRDRVKDLRRRILDDDATDGLSASLRNVLHPVLNGIVPPDIGDRCDTCRLSRVCRSTEVGTQVAEGVER